jgi:hypothetical protein
MAKKSRRIAGEKSWRLTNSVAAPGPCHSQAPDRRDRRRLHGVARVADEAGTARIVHQEAIGKHPEAFDVVQALRLAGGHRLRGRGIEQRGRGAGIVAQRRTQVEGIDLHPPVMDIQRTPQHQVGHRGLDRQLRRLVPARLRQRQRRGLAPLLLDEAEAEVAGPEQQAPAQRARIRTPQVKVQRHRQQQSEQRIDHRDQVPGFATCCENGSQRCVP